MPTYSLELTSDLTTLGNTIRSKTGATANMSVAQMATAVDGMSSASVNINSLKQIDIGTGNNYSLNGAVGTYAFQKLVDEFSVANLSVKIMLQALWNSVNNSIVKVNDIFKDSSCMVLPPVTISIDTQNMIDWTNGAQTFFPIGLPNFANGASVLTTIPIVTKDLANHSTVNKIFICNLNSGFAGCNALQTATMSNMFSATEWTTACRYDLSQMFYNCINLHIIDFTGVSPYINNDATAAKSNVPMDSLYNMLAYSTSSINKIIALPVDKIELDSNNNAFFRFCGMSNTDGRAPLMEGFTFATDNGTPITASWSGQIINMYQWGYGGCPDGTRMLQFKEITDYTSYESYKNDPDRWTQDYRYSLFNKPALEALIATLPDTSAVSDPASPTNQLILKSGAGSLTDGGSVSNISPATVSSAQARGWSIIFNS